MTAATSAQVTAASPSLPDVEESRARAARHHPAGPRRPAQHLTGIAGGLADLVARAEQLAARGPRVLLGITGAPGAGKSTLASAVVDALAGRAVLVPMDGFHLDDAVLETLGRRDSKGAPDTFDAAGYVALLRRLREQVDDVVYAPIFRRDLELAVAGALAVAHDVPLVVTEGNYLLADGAFTAVGELLDETWFVDVDPVLRRKRLVARHIAYGRAPEAAERWVAGSEDANAELVDATRSRADLLVRLEP